MIQEQLLPYGTEMHFYANSALLQQFNALCSSVNKPSKCDRDSYAKRTLSQHIRTELCPSAIWSKLLSGIDMIKSMSGRVLVKSAAALFDRNALTGMLCFVSCVLANSSPANAQPDKNTAGFELPEISAIPDIGALMLPGDRDPVPESSPQDLEISLRVIRSGKLDKKSGLFGMKGQNYWRSNVQTNWTFGPYDLTARLYANGTPNQSNGRAAILAGLRNWQGGREHYLRVLESFRSAGGYGNEIPPRIAYYEKISQDVRRVLEAAKQAKQDVEFLLSLLQRQRAYHLGTMRYGPADERSPVTADVVFQGGKATEHTQQTRTYFGKLDGQSDTTVERDVAPNSFEVTPGIRPMDVFTAGEANPYTEVPNIALEIMDLAGCEADQLDIILLGLETRLADLTLKDPADLNLTAQEMEWYRGTTRPAITRLFRETFRQAVYEAVRYAWAFSGQPMPRDMQLGPATEPGQAIRWHTPFHDPQSANYWVDAFGVPIVRDGTALRLPADLNGRHMRLYVAETGGTPPTDLGYLTSYTGFNSRLIAKQLSNGVKHQLVTWGRMNFGDGRVNLKANEAGRLTGSLELANIEPYWVGPHTNSMQTDEVMTPKFWGKLNATHIFSPAPATPDPAEVGYEFAKAPRMHLLHVANLDGALKATLNLRYIRDVSKPDSYDIDSGHQDVEIAITVKGISSEPPLQVCPEPIFEDPPQLRLVQFWENDREETRDDEFRLAQAVWPGHPYFVEAKFEEAPPQDIYRVKIDGARAIRVTRSKTDDALYRSDLIVFAPEESAQ